MTPWDCVGVIGFEGARGHYEFPVPNEATPWETIQSFATILTQTEARLFARLDDLSWFGEDPYCSRPDRGIDRGIYGTYGFISYSFNCHLEVVATGAADLIEDLTRPRLGSAVRRVFALRQSKVLPKAEAAAPGRALAYLMKAQHDLKRRKICHR